MNVFIDTEIWIFAKKGPKKEKYKKKQEYLRAKDLHELSKQFLKEQVKFNDILMTNHQLSEIFHVLGFRGFKLTLAKVEKYCFHLLKSNFIQFYPIFTEHITRSNYGK